MTKVSAPALILTLSAAALALTPVAAAAETVVLTATLSGANEVGGGAPDGNGAFRVEINTETGDFCYTLYGEKISAPTMAHVHTGAAGTNGGPVITMDVTGKGSDMCIAVEPEKLKPIVANPAGYYVNIHTADFPGGAVRGQLTKG
ncbi:CHRD domain-containing protein [Novosphingobium sediminis]|uniref:CHRD domain-containing protein n=1 Tax=Novosphingobium sediminis TaxID=707214 RepID=A0A512AH14_9SPHN|nr:CHRD domain-containing protein [Novosphingobium sediminis]GEN98932.1 CHRD domain-containing protein [Novosphingobium sediminis]